MVTSKTLLAEYEILARSHMEKHNLFARGWTFEYNSMKTALGLCDYSKKTIFLSEHWAQAGTPEEVLNTILHEVAHALVGPGHAHDRVWKVMARSLGANPQACSSSSAVIASRYIGRCAAGHEVNAHRLHKRVKTCAVCSPYFNFKNLITWYEGDKVAPMTPAYSAELEHLRLKYA